MRPYIKDYLKVRNQNKTVTAGSGEINLQFDKERIDN